MKGKERKRWLCGRIGANYGKHFIESVISHEFLIIQLFCYLDVSYPRLISLCLTFHIHSFFSLPGHTISQASGIPNAHNTNSLLRPEYEMNFHLSNRARAAGGRAHDCDSNMETQWCLHAKLGRGEGGSQWGDLLSSWNDQISKEKMGGGEEIFPNLWNK